jgi:hypothetical protein
MCLKKEAEKILKYKDLTIEIQRMWNVKTRVIPVVIGATGTVSKSFRKYVSDIPGNRDVRELQKTAILGTAYILRKVLTYKNQRANAGTRNRGTVNNKDRIDATMYPLGTWLVSGICVWTPCIKETMMMMIMVMMMMMIIIIIIMSKQNTNDLHQESNPTTSGL